MVFHQDSMGADLLPPDSGPPSLVNFQTVFSLSADDEIWTMCEKLFPNSLHNSSLALFFFFFRNSNSRWWKAHLAPTSSNNKAWWDLRCLTMTLQGCFWTCGFPRVPDNVRSTRFSACICWLLLEFHNKAQQHRGFMMMFCCPNRDTPPPTSNISCTEKALYVCALCMVGNYLFVVPY